MQSQNHLWNATSGWSFTKEAAPLRADLILAFGSGHALAFTPALQELQDAHRGAIIASVSTAGEIAGDVVVDDSIVALSMAFERTSVRAHLVTIGPDEAIEGLAHRLAREINTEELAHVLLFSDGIHVNATKLTAGLAASLPAHVAITGGLAADGARFECTYVGLGAFVAPRQIVAIALYGSSLRIGYGSVGGWSAFGPERVVTDSSDNVVKSLDGEPALALYKRYLGDAAAELPASALRFPLALLGVDGTAPLVRTILSVDDAHETMTFAGDVPMGSRVQLMRASFDALLDGAEQAASNARRELGQDASAAILVSCVGRRLVLKQQTEEEIEGVRRVLGNGPVLAGFYSYGEITPARQGGPCELHNQTMTITTLSEC
jgi:hypothetical protein